MTPSHSSDLETAADSCNAVIPAGVSNPRRQPDIVATGFRKKSGRGLTPESRMPKLYQYS